MDKRTFLWKELGSNLDTSFIIISAVTSMVLLVLSLLKLVNVFTVLPLISAALGTIGVALRRDRSAETKITQSLEEILPTLRGEKKIQVFARQASAYQFLINEVIKKPDIIKEAIFIQYSCTMSFNMLCDLLRKGAKVTIFAQHEEFPQEIGSQRQANRIKGMINDLPDHLGADIQDPSNLEVYKYKVPGSISAIKIDDRILCMGWYTYDYAKSTNYAGDKVEVSGHDRATIIAWQGTEEFEAQNTTFTVLIENYRANAEKVLYA